MSLLELTKRVERSLYWLVYTELLTNGYIADKSLYSNNRPGYLAAMLQVEINKGFAVEILGGSNSEELGVRKTPLIVIEPGGYYNGDIGLGGVVTYVTQESGKLTRVMAQARTSDYRIGLKLVSKNSTERRVLESIAHQAVGQIGYIPDYSDPTVLYHFERVLASSIPDTEFGVTNNGYYYLIKDLYEGGSKSSQADISNIIDITIKDSNDEDISTIS